MLDYSIHQINKMHIHVNGKALQAQYKTPSFAVHYIPTIHLYSMNHHLKNHRHFSLEI